MLRARIITLFLIPSLMGLSSFAEPKKVSAISVGAQRLSVDSDWDCRSGENVEFHATYNGWDIFEHKRIRRVEIKQKLLKYIREAESYILMSFFLFDNMYSAVTPQSQVTNEIVEALVAKKKQNPKIRIAIILDPLNRAYSRRVPESLKTFETIGIDVFFSDLLTTKSATRVGVAEGLRELGHGASQLSGGFFGSSFNEISSRVNTSKELDGHNIDLEVIQEAIGLKANHRKILTADASGGRRRAIVSSANPHNGSDDSTNTAISVSGKMAVYIYNNLRKDLEHSLNKQSLTPFKVGPKESNKYVWLSKESEANYPKIFRSMGTKQKHKYLAQEFPLYAIELDSGRQKNRVCTKYITEIEIKKEILEQLQKAEPDDLIRIQMFYLSDRDVVEAIKTVANQSNRTKSIRLLLDPSKDAFNSIKDGTPNRQVGHDLFINAKNIEIRWYATHGEQNHAKAMSITNPRTGKKFIFTGSANWTGKNLNDINMESNLAVKGAKKSTDKFNQLFDKLWFNSEDGVLYSWDYQSYDLETSLYLNLGYSKIKHLSDDELATLAISKFNSVAEHFYTLIAYSSQQKGILNLLNKDQRKTWVSEKIENDPSTTLRALSYIYGQKEYQGLSREEQEGLKSKYFGEWHIGEKWGYVSW